MSAESSELEVAMTLDSEVQLLSKDQSDGPAELVARSSPSKAWWSIAAFFTFLGLVVILQIASGTYQSEFSAYPDEPSHYVTSLMLRDYITHFHFQSPVQFAKDYYYHYPKVAFGHWPPFFYIVQSLWMLLFSASRVSVRLELALTTAILACAVFREARRWFGMKLALATGLLLVCLPLVQTYSDQEMAESLLTLLCFWTTVYFAQYAEAERWRDSLLFGLFCSLAILTKGSGWLLFMVPPTVIVLTRKWSLLRQRSFWTPFAIVFALCVPWQLMTMRMAEKGWDGGSKPSFAYTLTALVSFLELFPQILGPVLLFLMLVGIVSLVFSKWMRGTVSARAAAMFALVIAVWIFHAVVPAGVEDRKLVLTVPAMVLFAVAGAVVIAQKIPLNSSLFRWRWELIGIITVASFFAWTFYVPKVQHYGYAEAAQFLATKPSLDAATMLVSSEAGGEGLLVSELAMQEPHPSCVIIRGTKALAQMEWNAANYKSLYSHPAEILQYLKTEKVQLVVVDSFAPQVRFPHNDLLKKTIDEAHCFQLLARFPDRKTKPTGEVLIYLFKP